MKVKVEQLEKLIKKDTGRSFQINVYESLSNKKHFYHYYGNILCCGFDSISGIYDEAFSAVCAGSACKFEQTMHYKKYLY